MTGLSLFSLGMVGGGASAGNQSDIAYRISVVSGSPETRVSLRLIQGQDTALDFTLLDSDGGAFNLTGGSLLWTLRKERPGSAIEGDAELQIVPTIVSPSGGTATLDLTASQLDLLALGEHSWDMWFIDAGGKRRRFIAPSPASVVEAFTV